MTTAVKVIGVGMTPFTSPKAGIPYTQSGPEAIRSALLDAGIAYRDIDEVFASYIYGDTCCGQRIAYEVGLTGIRISNVNNACASGSTAIYLARQAILSGESECVLAVGFEQMSPGALTSPYNDRPHPFEMFMEPMKQIQGITDQVLTAQLFGGAGREHMERYGTSREAFAMVAVKARQHAGRNPHAVFREALTLDEVLQSPTIFDPLTRYQCCPPTCGAAAAILCSEDFSRRKGLKNAVTLAGQAMTTDFSSTFDSGSMMRVAGYDMAATSATKLYESTGIGPEDVDVIELHDCFTANELITYEALQLTPEGTAEQFIRDGDTTYGGKYVINPSGGLLSKGHPIGATGLAQCVELVWQLRGQAEGRQVENARIALQHNLGIGGACVVTLYSAGD
jgi:acetyl-CoA acetyltransferase